MKKPAFKNKVNPGLLWTHYAEEPPWKEGNGVGDGESPVTVGAGCIGDEGLPWDRRQKICSRLQHIVGARNRAAKLKLRIGSTDQPQ